MAFKKLTNPYVQLSRRTAQNVSQSLTGYCILIQVWHDPCYVRARSIYRLAKYGLHNLYNLNACTGAVIVYYSFCR